MKRVILVAVLLSGCASGASRSTMKTEDSGAVTLYGSKEDAMPEAVALMNEHCGMNKWKVVKEEKVKTGDTIINWGSGITTAQPQQGTLLTYNCLR